LEDLGVDERITKYILKKWDGGMDWYDLAKNTDKWRVPVSAVINLRHS